MLSTLGVACFLQKKKEVFNLFFKFLVSRYDGK